MVGARQTLPSDPHERYREDGDILGCNRIRCSRCGAWLRNIAGMKIDVATLSRDEHLEFYDGLGARRRDWPFLTTNVGGEMYRVYACKCGWDQTPSVKWLNSSDRDGWACAGHPAR